MKFKYLIILFNIILVFFLFFVTLMPIMLMGHELAANLWRSTWPIALLLALVLAGLNIYFIKNYQLFRLLEREDWPALAYYLEQKMYKKDKYSSRKVRLLANAYLVLCDFPSIFQLESKVAVANPAIIAKNALVFGTARLLSGDYNGAGAFFKNILARGKAQKEQWLLWFLRISQMLSGDLHQAEAGFSTLASSSDDIVVTGLSAYFLAHSLENYSLKPEECRSAYKKGRERVIEALKDINGWNKEAQSIGTEVHTAIIKKYINEAGKWLFEQ